MAVVRVKNDRVGEAVCDALNLLGGIGKVVKDGFKVLVKPNVCLVAEPGSGVITDHRVVKAIVQEVLAVGGEPIVAESSIGSSPETTQASLEAAKLIDLERLGVKVVNLDEDVVVEVPISKGKALKSIGIAKTVLNCDVRISVPVLKYHPEARVTLGLKNMKGCLPGGNKAKTHEVGLHQAIADYNTILKPHLTVIDGIVAGAWGNIEPVKINVIVAGIDPVATDAVGAKILGVNPHEVQHLRLCAGAGLGTVNLNEIKVVGLSLREACIFR